jgi:hypothetical protein
MRYRQDQLALAVPKFIDTIKSKFDDFDYHIMVVDGDGETNNNGEGGETRLCNEVCPNLACKVGEDCCPIDNGQLSGIGMPCCAIRATRATESRPRDTRATGPGAQAPCFPRGSRREQALPDRRWRWPPLPREGADGPGRDLRVHRQGREPAATARSARRSRRRCRRTINDPAAATGIFSVTTRC